MRNDWFWGTKYLGRFNDCEPRLEFLYLPVFSPFEAQKATLTISFDKTCILKCEHENLYPLCMRNSLARQHWTIVRAKGPSHHGWTTVAWSGGFSRLTVAMAFLNPTVDNTARSNIPWQWYCNQKPCWDTCVSVQMECNLVQKTSLLLHPIHVWNDLYLALSLSLPLLLYLSSYPLYIFILNSNKLIFTHNFSSIPLPSPTVAAFFHGGNGFRKPPGTVPSPQISKGEIR